MIPVGDRPILLHIMEGFARSGFKEFVLCLGYKGEVVRNYFLNFPAMTAEVTVDLGTGAVKTLKGPRYDWKVTLVNTGVPTGTGGRIKRVAGHLGGEPFMVTYGDGLADIDFRELYAFHRKMGRLATVTGVREVSRFGVIESKGTGLVDRFKEKPVLEGRVSGGFFVFEPGVLDYLDEDGVLEGEPLERLAREQQLALFPHDGFFMSMDTYRDFLRLNEMYEAGRTPWTRHEP